MADQPKVLHIVERLDRGATEAWLVRMLRHAYVRGVSVDWTFYCSLPGQGNMDDDVRNLGARIVHSPVPIGNTARFIKALRAELKRGAYDVIHSHHDLMSGIYLAAALGLQIDKRVVHVHNAGNAVPTPSNAKQAVLKPFLRRFCISQADRIVGISNHTLDFFLDGRQRRAGRDVVVYCGVDSTPFESSKAERTAFRHSLGFPDSSRILLFAGRIVPEKEPLFAVDVLARMRAVDPNIHAVFVGAGSLTDAVDERAKSLGLSEYCRSLGWRSDVAEIMSCCDVFIQPGPETPPEGLGLAIVEAQLAGLHLLFSLGIPDDALLPHSSFRRVPLAAGADAWANAAIDLLKTPLPSRELAVRGLRDSRFEMNRAFSDLTALYE